MEQTSSQEIAEMRKPSVLEGFLSEREYASQRGVTIRTCQRDRALRQSPPYVVIGKRVYYRIEAVRNWLLKRERVEERQPQSLARRGIR